MKKTSAFLFLLTFVHVMGWSQNFSVSDLPHAALTNATDLDAGDYDNDGDLDLLVRWFDLPNSLWKAEVFKNTSTLSVISFATTGIFLTDISGACRWVDFNNDGKLDILVSGSDGTGDFLRVHVNESGSFSGIIPVSTDLATAMDWGDMDADGDNDLLITTATGSTLLTRIDGTTFSHSVNNIFSLSSILTDYDLDNDLDVIGDGIYSNRGDEFIETHALFPTASGYSNMGHMYSTDLDGDGDRDMIRGEEIRARGSINYLAVAYFNVNNIFTRAEIETVDDFSGGPIYPLGAADFDNNGDMDIAYTTEANSINYFIRFREVKSQRVTTFDLPANSRFHNLGGHAFADFNGDQKIDIIETGSYVNTVNSETVAYARVYKNATVTANAKPSIPLNLKTTIQNTSVTLSWDKSSDTETAGASIEYNFYLRQGLDTLISSYATRSGKPRINSIKGSFEANRFYIPALLNNGSYQWAVQAKDKGGNYSAFSAESNFEFSNGKSDVNHFSSLTDQQVNYDRASDHFVLVGVQNGNIYGVLLDGKFGERKSSLKKLNQFSSTCHSPKVSVDSAGNYLVTWIGDSTTTPQSMWGKFVKSDLSFTQANEWRASEKVFYDLTSNAIISQDARYNHLQKSFDLAWIFSGDIAGASVRRVTLQNNAVKRDPVKNINWTYKSGVLHGARGHLDISIDSDPGAGRSLVVYSYEDERAELGITSLGKIYFQELDQNLVAVKDSVVAPTFTLGDSPHIVFNPYLGNFIAVWNAHFLHQASPLPQDGDIESRDVAAALLTLTPTGPLSSYIFPSTISKAQQQGGEGGTLDPNVSFNYKRNEFLVSWFNTNSNKIYGQRINALDKTTVTVDEFALKENAEFPVTIFSPKWNQFLMGSILNGEGSTSLVKIPKDQAPKVTSLSSVKGYAGDKIIITGSNFGKTPFLNAVYFGSVKAEVDVLFWDQTKLQVTVPPGLTREKVPVVVVYDDQPSNATILFENITISSLTSITPLQGEVGEVVSIKGSNFPLDKANFQVMFGSVQATPGDIVENTSTEIKVKVPADVVRGLQDITVVIQDIPNTFANQFYAIRKSVINAVSMSEGGTDFVSCRNIKIEGMNFSDRRSDLTVKLGEVTLPLKYIISASNTLLIVQIPKAVTSGDEKWPIYVSTVDGVAVSPGTQEIKLGSVVSKLYYPDEFKFSTRPDDQIDLAVEVHNSCSVEEVKFWTKGISEPESKWKSRTLGIDLFEGNKIDFSIPEAEFPDDPLGLEGYYEVKDSLVSVESEKFKVFRNYVGSDLTDVIPDLTFGGDASDYNIVSIPYTLSPNKINTVFKSILDNYGYDKTKWRIAHYVNDGTTASYKEYLSGLDVIEPGKGYWIIIRNEQEVFFDMGRYVNSTYDPFEITLEHGWNQIGNPYDFNLSWSDIIAFNTDNIENITDIESYKTFKNGAFVTTNTIDRFRGGFVRYNGTVPVTLKIPFTQNESINGGRFTLNESFPSDLNAKEWRIALDLSGGELRNKISSFGMHPKGTDGEDERDEHRLPAFAQSLDLSFPHALSTSVVATNDYHTWEFNVFNTTGSKEITLNWNNTSFGDNDRQLFLHDRAGERLINMRAQNSYTFTYQEGHHFNIYFGDQSYIEDQSRPDVIVLSDAYPNPMKGTTTIPFTVTKDQTQVQLAIYNLQGKEITTLVNNKLAAGFYELEWDGRSEAGEQISSGIVMYRLHTSQPGSATRSIVKKLVIAP